MIVIQIRRSERRKQYLILVDSKKGEERKKYFLFLNQIKIGKKKMLGEVESCMVLSPQICQIWVLGTPVICLFIKVMI